MAKKFPDSPVETSTNSPQNHSDGNQMNTVTHELPETRNWREPYKAAIRELDSSKLADRIAEAKRVLVQRARNYSRKPETLGRRASCRRRNV